MKTGEATSASSERVVGHLELAEDLTHETFVRAFRALGPSLGPHLAPKIDSRTT